MTEGLRHVRVERYEGARHLIFRDAPQSMEAVVEFVA